MGDIIYGGDIPTATKRIPLLSLSFSLPKISFFALLNFDTKKGNWVISIKEKNITSSQKVTTHFIVFNNSNFS